MEKLDLTKHDKRYYTAKIQPELITFDPVHYISICGKGDPSGKDFAEHIEALYTTAYALKFHFKEKGKDFVVAKMEALWWYDEKKFPNESISTASVNIPRSEWEYRLLIRLPNFVSQQHVQASRDKAFNKKQLQLINQVDYFTLEEGLCIQVMHVGPFDTEIETLKVIKEFSDKNKLYKNGLHHEIYLSDFRKTKPEKLKTILREPVKGELRDVIVL